MSDLPDSVTIPILLNNLRLMADKNRDRHLPLTARFMCEAADVIERLVEERNDLASQCEAYASAYSAAVSGKVAEQMWDGEHPVIIED